MKKEYFTILVIYRVITQVMLKAFIDNTVIHIPLTTRLHDLGNVITESLRQHGLYFYDVTFKDVKISQKYKPHYYKSPNNNIQLFEIYTDIVKTKKNITLFNSKLLFDSSKLLVTVNKTDDITNNDLPNVLETLNISLSNNKFKIIDNNPKNFMLTLSSITEPTIVRVGYNGVNVINGQKWKSKVIDNNDVDYILCNGYTYIEGIKVNTINNKNLYKQLSLSTHGDDTLVFEVYRMYDKNFKVYSMDRQKFLDVNSFPLKDENLIFYEKIKGKTIDNNPTLDDFGFVNGDSVNITQQKVIFQIIIHKLLNETKSAIINVRENETTKMLQKQIRHLCGYNINDQRLIYQGKQLDTNALLSSYGITQNSTLFFSFRFYNNSVNMQKDNNRSNRIVDKLITQEIGDYDCIFDHRNINCNSYESCVININQDENCNIEDLINGIKNL